MNGINKFSPSLSVAARHSSLMLLSHLIIIIIIVFFNNKLTNPTMCTITEIHTCRITDAILVHAS